MVTCQLSRSFLHKAKSQIFSSSLKLFHKDNSYIDFQFSLCSCCSYVCCPCCFRACCFVNASLVTFALPVADVSVVAALAKIVVASGVVIYVADNSFAVTL
jgi:hypothetical protein